MPASIPDSPESYQYSVQLFLVLAVGWHPLFPICFMHFRLAFARKGISLPSIFQFLAFFLTQDRLPKTRPVCVDGFWCILKVVCCQSGGHKSLDSFSISDTHAGDWACQRRGGLAAPVFEQCLLKYEIRSMIQIINKLKNIN